ncbi:MAG: fluoride efflux transporter CrcB [Ignavibacteriales bacterium CG_4_9_14_3_um_filter_34_10]|nr:MAG: fluoride efflux transporter CrcB [Ignavibacteriales bacterium CG_4_9_14_3_um_filter_34_10]
MQKIFLVGLGGFLGSVFRYLLSGFVQKASNIVSFPVGTLSVNLIGCLVIGLLAGLSESRQLFGENARLFIFIGLLGGFTTFSTFGYEVFSFMRDGEFVSSFLNIFLHLFFSIILVWLGFSLAKLI